MSWRQMSDLTISSRIRVYLRTYATNTEQMLEGFRIPLLVAAGSEKQEGELTETQLYLFSQTPPLLIYFLSWGTLLPLAGRVKIVLPHLAANIEMTEMLCPELQLPGIFRVSIHVVHTKIRKVVRHV